MKRLLTTFVLMVAVTGGVIWGAARRGTEVPTARSDSAWYQSRKADLTKSLAHATPGSDRAFKLQSKLAKLDNWREGEARMGYPEEFARILYEMRVPADRTSPEYQPGYLVREVGKARQSARTPDKAMSWQSRGPGNVAGRARVIVVDPDDPTGNTWFITSVGGGVWHTADAGATWTALMDGLPTLSMQSLAMAASNTSVLYAGTGESYFNIDSLNGNGIFKSTDKGATWVALAGTMGDPRFNNVSRIIVSPTDPDLVLAATTVGRYKSSLTPSTHIFRSVDGGLNWTEVFQQSNGGGGSGARVQQLIADPTNFAIQYAAVHQNGVLKSTDAGLTWNYTNSGITDFAGRFELAISPVNTSYLYASAEGATSSNLFVSQDGGATWDEMANTSGTDAWLGSQGWYDNTIICDPTSTAVVYVGGPQLYQLDLDTVNSTYSSTPLATYGFPHPDHHYLQIVQPAVGSWFLLGTNDGGVARTASGVTGFTMPINGMVTTQFYGVDKRPGASAYLGGMQDNGTWQSPLDPASGDLWDFRIGGDGYETDWHFDDPEKLMGGYQYNGLVRSLNGGLTWESAANGLTDTGSGNAPFITKIGQSNARPDDIYAVGAQGVWRSTDFGGSWSLTALNTSQWGNLSSFHDIRVSPANPDIVWAGARMDFSADIMVSTDAGASFTSVPDYTAVTLGGISGLATHPTEPNTAYVLFSFSERPKVLKTTDLGATWTDISGFGSGTSTVSTNGFPDVAVYDLLVWPNDPQHIWVGSEIGLIESLDGGATWALANNGLPSVGVWFLKAVEDQIVVATHGRGIWSTTVPDLIVGQTFNPLFDSMAQMPGGDLTLAFTLRSAYDSTQVWVDGAKVQTFAANLPLESQGLSVPVVAAGDVSAFARGFKDGLTYDSTTKQVYAYPMAAPVYAYNNNLDDGGNLPVITDGFSVATPAGFTDPALHTVHDYADDVAYTATLMAPIKVSPLSTLTFDEIAIVEPGEPGSVFGDSNFWDYVTVEGSSDGLVWLPLAGGWDCRDDPDWLSAYNGSSPGDASMYRTRSIVLNDTFAAGDVVLLRWTLVADGAVTGWGWAVDNIDVTPTGISGVGDTPRVVSLAQNYPNPFNPSTTISFNLPRSGRTKLQIYDARGALVRTLIEGNRPAGPQSVVWDGLDSYGRQSASGVYLYRLEADKVMQQRKMTLVK